MTEIPHLAFPLRIVNGRAVEADQGSPEHLAQQVHAACLTPQGWRVEAPDFGIPPVLMRGGGVDLDDLQAALAASVPDAPVSAEEVAETLDMPGDERAEHIRILIDEGT